jgi:hypothetical protein
LTLAVFIDAMGWEIANQHGFLKDLLPERRPLDTVFGYSSTCDPTILTGLSPQEHGHFAFYAYAPERSPFKELRWLNLLPKQLAARGRVRQQISKLVRTQLGYTGYFQLYNAPFDLLPHLDYTERRDLYQPGGIINGQRTIFDDLRDSGTPFHLSDWRKPERENLDAAAAAITSAGPRFAYLFLAELDAILHAQGTQSSAIEKKVRWYEQELGKLLSLAERNYDQVSLVVFSDHGMTDISSEFDLMTIIESLPLIRGEDYFAVYDSTMARFWFLGDRAEAIICDKLERYRQGRWLSDSDLQHWGCNFPDRRYGHKFYLMNPGVLLNPSFMGHTRLAGMHGYAPEDKDSVAFFAATESTLGFPNGLADIRKFLWRSLCLQPAREVCA